MDHKTATRMHVLARPARAALLALAAAGSLAATGAQAQAFPAKAITVIVGFAPSGGTDITARVIARKFQEVIGQPVVVENRAGAGGNIAADLQAKATPDGHTISLAAVGPLTVAPHMVANLPYDPRRDIAPITLAVSFANVLVVHPSVPANTIAEFIRLANAKPDSIGYATSGIGGTGHLAGELFKMLGKAPVIHVPYKGGGPAMTDLLGGQVPAGFASAPSAIPHIKSGKIRALGVTTARRISLLPDVPAMSESLAGYEAANWYAYVAPGKTPRPVIDRLNRDLVRSLNDPEIRAELAKHGMDAIPSTPEEMARYVEREYAVWGKVVKEAKIEAQ